MKIPSFKKGSGKRNWKKEATDILMDPTRVVTSYPCEMSEQEKKTMTNMPMSMSKEME